MSVHGQSPRSTLFPYTTLFRSVVRPNGSTYFCIETEKVSFCAERINFSVRDRARDTRPRAVAHRIRTIVFRSEEHSELQSLTNIVCRLLLEKKNRKKNITSDIQ